jgi:tetratricopeptide (TPR) repeat protein
MGMVAAQTGNIRFALHMLEKGLPRVPEELKGRDVLANIYFASGRVPEGERIWLELQKSHPDLAEAHHGVGLVRLAQQKTDEAIQNLVKAVQLDQHSALYHHDLGRAFEQAARVQEAVHAYQKSIALAPDSPRSYPSLGVLLLLGNLAPAAIQCFRKAYELDPNSSDGYFYLAQALAEEENLAEAEKHVRRSISLNPNSARSYILLGTILQQFGDFEGGKEAFLKAIELNPVLTGPYSGLSTGTKFTEEDRPIIDKMEAVLAKAPLNDTGREQINYALAKAHDDLKQYEAAMRHYDVANALAAQRQKDFSRAFYPQKEAGFVDLVEEKFTREFFEANRDLGDPSERPVFVVGMIRSGTTLTEQILSSHPDVSGAGELRFWIENAPTPNNTALWTLDKAVAERLGKGYLEVLERAAPNTSRATDKMPLNFLGLGFIHTILPNARIVHCRRNPIDNCLSIYMTQYKGSPEFGHVRENIVFMYRQYQRIMEHWRSVLPPDRFLEVNYEDLVSDKEAETRKMIDFIGLPWDDACLYHEKNENSVRTPSLWQARQPIYNTSVEKWRRYEPWLGAFAELLPTAE